MAMSINGTDAERDDKAAAHGGHRHLVEQVLQAEFAGLLDPIDIERLTATSLARFENAPVRAFVPILAARTARRLARAHLAEGSGATIAVAVGEHDDEPAASSCSVEVPMTMDHESRWAG